MNQHPDADTTRDPRRCDVMLEQAPWIRQNLPRYDRWETVALLAGLLTCPGCHANCVRIEGLVHLAVGLANGNHTPRRDDLVVWFNRHFSEVFLRRLEDPLEDVFISNIIDHSGNHRIFEGIWERNDYWLQCLIDVFRFLPRKPEYRAMIRSVSALLDLSEAVAERNGLTRFIHGSGEPKGRVFLPPRDELTAYAAHVVFSGGDLDALGINSADLAPFVCPDTDNPKILAAHLENSPLERRPLLQRNGSYLLALPTAVSVAIRRFVVETVRENGDILQLDSLVNQRQAKALSDEALSRLDAEPWDVQLPPWTAAPPVSLTLMPFRFDSDKFGLVCMINPPLENVLRFGFGQFEEGDDRWDRVVDDLTRITEFISSTPGFRRGLLIFSLGGLGTGLALGLPDIAEPWETVSFSVPNLLTLAMLPDVDMLMIWRLAVQERRAHARGVRLVNPNGDFNLLAEWRANDFAFIPDDAPVGSGNVLVAPTINALLAIRQETRVRLDLHAVLRTNPSRWLLAERKGAHSPFARSRETPFFVVPALATRGELAGVAEAPGVSWWLICMVRPQSPRERGTIYQLWDCFAEWLPPVGLELSSRYAPANAVFELEIVMPDLATWPERGEIKRDAGVVPLSWRRTQLGVQLEITESFFRTFAQPANIAEREIVRALLEIGSSLLGNSPSADEIARLRDNILPAGNARYFHVTSANDASFAVIHGPSPPYLARPEVVAEVSQELGHAVAPQFLGQFTEDRQEVRRQIRSAVAHLKNRISEVLRPLNLAAVVKRCLTVLDSVHRDQHTWNLSAAALFALSSDNAELLREAQEQESNRSGTNLAARIVIETALFTSLTDGGADVPDSTLDELLAMTQTLIRIADYDQPVRADFPAGRVILTASGAFKVRNDFLDSMRTAYLRTSFEEGFVAAAGRYAQHYGSAEEQELPDDFGRFNSAMASEFGLTAEELIHLGEALNEIGAKQGRSILELRRSEFIALVAQELEIETSHLERFVSSFRIYPRASWDAELPQACEPRDVFPWLFKRRFSLVRRPIIEVSRDADPRMIVSPVMVRESLRHTVSTAHSGDFPLGYFATQQMREFHQHAVDRRSRRFVNDLAADFRRGGFQCRTNVDMAALGASPALGDIDILAWRSLPTPQVVILECKALRNARSTSEILAQLDHFRGETGDLLRKHEQRREWIGANLSDLAAYIGQEVKAVRDGIVTTHRVPMQFVPTEKGTTQFLDVASVKREFNLG